MDKKTFSKKFETPGWFYHREILKALKGDGTATLSAVLWGGKSLGINMEETYCGGSLSKKSKCNLLYPMTRDEVAG